MKTYQGPAPDTRDLINASRNAILADINAAWSRFQLRHHRAKYYTSPHDMFLHAPETTNWRQLWTAIEYRIWTKYEQFAYRSLGPTACPNPACRAECFRTDVFYPMCGCPHAENITRGGLKPAA